MDPLGDREEGGVALDHQPARVDTGAARVGEKGLEHLGDAAAGCGRVDIEHRVAGEHRLRGLSHPLELRRSVAADQRLEPGGVERLHLHLTQLGHLLEDHLVRTTSRTRA